MTLDPNAAAPPAVHPHTPADDREEIYFDGSPLLRAEAGRLMLFWGVALLLLAGPVVFMVLQKEHHSPSAVVWLICIGLAAVAAILPIIQRKTIRYRITNYRIDYERGLLAKNIDTIELWHVEDIRFHQSILDRMLNVGSITIVAHDETTPVLPMRGLPSPRPLFELLKQRVIAVKRQSGVLKVDPG